MGYSSAQAKEFIYAIGPLIKAEATNRGYKTCAAVIAQAIIESAAGTSGLAKYHNYFGLKCGSKWQGKSVNMKTKEEYTPGVLTSIKDYFRTYDNMAAGVKGYFDFINTSRYANLKNAKDYKEYALLIKQDGYATSSTYINTLCSTVSKYDLTCFESGRPNLKKGDKSVWVSELQNLLNQHGVCNGVLKVDGIYGPLTMSAVVEFQADKNINKTGEVDQITWSKLFNE